MYDFPILFLPLSNNEFIIELIPLIIYNLHIYLYSKPTYLKIELYIKNKQVLNYIPNLLKKSCTLFSVCSILPSLCMVVKTAACVDLSKFSDSIV